jgi:cation:H+ antiporter
VLTAVLLVLSGAVVLTAGAGAAVRGVTRFARAHGISSFVLGAVLFGIHLGSLGATLVASGKDQPALAAGTAMGTMAFLLGVGFGLALLVSKRPVEAPAPMMTLLPLAALALAALALRDLQVSRGEGVVLVGAYLAYLVTILRRADDGTVRALAEEADREASERFPRLPGWFLALGGLGLVFIGATLLVDGGVRILAHSGLTAGFVGSAIIGSLAAADGVLLGVTPVRRGAFELATGDLLGTVAAFSTAALGLAALIHPVVLAGSAVSVALMAVAVLYTVVATAFLARGRAGKVVGASLVVLFAAWLAIAWRY